MQSLILPWKRKGKKRKKKLLQLGVFVFGHPCKYWRCPTGLNFCSWDELCCSSCGIVNLRFLLFFQSFHCTLEDVTHSHSQSYQSVRPSYLRPRDRGNNKENADCPIAKARYSSHFHIPLIFCSLLSQLCSIRYVYIYAFLFTFSHFRKKGFERRFTLPGGEQHVSPAQQS